jgi:phosphoenolpyruvate synthase/pyruvate phosphate dikinase
MEAKPDFILHLSDVSAELPLVGGKGASLARLAAAGLPVPDGFHVTTAAYTQFVATNHLEAEITAALATIDPAQPATLEAAAQRIRAAFEAGQMPEAIAAEIAAAHTTLGEPQGKSSCDLPVAVRSSATAEDLPELSFAGQQETYLNVQGGAAVQAAVQRCWGSLWTPRAIGYRLQHGIDQRAVSLAAVVQRLVPAEAAGILALLLRQGNPPLLSRPVI